MSLQLKRRVEFFFCIFFLHKTSFFKLILDGLSDFHQNWFRSSTDHAGKNYGVLVDLVQAFSNTARTNSKKRPAKMDLRLYLRNGLAY